MYSEKRNPVWNSLKRVQRLVNKYQSTRVSPRFLRNSGSYKASILPGYVVFCVLDKLSQPLPGWPSAFLPPTSSSKGRAYTWAQGPTLSIWLTCPINSDPYTVRNQTWQTEEDSSTLYLHKDLPLNSASLWSISSSFLAFLGVGILCTLHWLSLKVFFQSTYSWEQM